MGIAWHATEHLVLDRDGLVWHARGGPDEDDPHPSWRLLGPIDGGLDLPEGLDAELVECWDLWRDRFDDRAEQLWSYWNRG